MLANKCHGDFISEIFRFQDAYSKEKYAFWLNCLKKYNLTGKHEYLFAKKIKKTTSSQHDLEKSDFYVIGRCYWIIKMHDGQSRKMKNNYRLSTHRLCELSFQEKVEA
ncbi:hypothetical protein Glove_5g22 [Diversispora epigaea]|uniref:Uncharacterized protein n=1 Tax=Diversispora epigaea TaxID=1348612 RepID=A0A397JY17_9GLOM|nr:hypothetical protein Glove_5g22 [Diversispora epigaea]